MSWADRLNFRQGKNDDLSTHHLRHNNKKLCHCQIPNKASSSLFLKSTVPAVCLPYGGVGKNHNPKKGDEKSEATSARTY
jgi:hypothetical protein